MGGLRQRNCLPSSTLSCRSMNVCTPCKPRCLDNGTNYSPYHHIFNATNAQVTFTNAALAGLQTAPSSRATAFERSHGDSVHLQCERGNSHHSDSDNSGLCKRHSVIIRPRLPGHSETLRMMMPPRAVKSRGLHIIAPDFYQELGDSGYVVPWGMYCFASAEKVSTCALAQA
jgi:hypothetical protein